MTGSERPLGVNVPGPAHGNADQSPRPTPPPPTNDPQPPLITITPDPTPSNELNIMKDFIEHTEKSNARIQKLNKLKVQRRLNQTTHNTDPVSNDEPEDPLPIISSYMHSEMPPRAPPNSNDFLSPGTPIPDPVLSADGPSSVTLRKRPEQVSSALVTHSSSSTNSVDWLTLIASSSSDPTNRLQLNVTSIPAGILQMAFNHMSMLTTDALAKIQKNENLNSRRYRLAMV
ncbi:hypothetical protein K439DRAFT_1614976 [Ramaria rubella]|nr:hypothetical protein K439DRAFT_1614976 [Ramaria rubella]